VLDDDAATNLFRVANQDMCDFSDDYNQKVVGGNVHKDNSSD
jgi:hypothetical protein